MAEETISILKVETGEAVKSVNDLKENIKILKSNLGELEIGTQEYQNTLDELKVNQNALKDAMYATTSSMADVAAAATGASKSYNSLVHQMAALKEEWRATNDEARRNELGEQIAEINQQLKDMDASVGNFQRNVGNYESGVSGLVAKFDAWGNTLKMMPPTLGAAKESIGKVGETMQLVGKQPILGIIGLLAPIIMKITNSLKENETAMDAVKKVMSALHPVFDLTAGVLEKVAEGFANIVDWVLNLVGGSGLFNSLIAKASGVGNALLQYILAPIRSAISAIKGLGKIIGDVIKGNWGDVKAHAQEAGQGIADAWKEGFSFKANFEEGQKVGDTFLKGVKANKEAAKEAGKELATAMHEGFNEAEDELAAIAAEEEFNQELAYQQQWQQEQNDALLQGLHDRFDAEQRAREQDAALEKAVADETTAYIKKQKEERLKLTMATLDAAASATSGILNSLADMYESDEKNAEKNAKKVKALRIASATIEMLQGAVTAFTSAQSIPPPFGQIIGAANAAAVVAMGVANIAKIKSTNMTSESGSSAAPAVPAAVSAPNVETNLPSVRNVTSASEEDRLNQMASSQRVYILDSDIEAAGNRRKAVVSETSF